MKCVLVCGSKVIKELNADSCYDAIKDMWDYLTITDDIDDIPRDWSFTDFVDLLITHNVVPINSMATIKLIR